MHCDTLNGPHKAGSTAAIRLPIWVPTTKPDLSRHKVGTHPWSASPMDRIMHGLHNAWALRPRSSVKLGVLRAPSLTTTSLLTAGLNALTASSMPVFQPLVF